MHPKSQARVNRKILHSPIFLSKTDFIKLTFNTFMLRLLVRTYFVERKKLICLLKFKVGIESEFDKNESNKNFKAKFYFLNNSNDVNTVKEVCCQKNI